MLLSKIKIIIGAVVLSGLMVGGAATAAMNRNDNTSLASTASTSSYLQNVKPEKHTVKDDSKVLAKKEAQEASVKDISKNNENVNDQNVKENKLVSKELNCPKIGLNLVMDVPESWEGKYYVNEYSYVYQVGTGTVSDSDKIEEKVIEIVFKDPETGYEFPLFTIMKRNNAPLDQVFLDNVIVKNFNGEEYMIGGPTGSFDEPKSAFDKYVVMHDESIAVMNSLRTK